MQYLGLGNGFRRRQSVGFATSLTLDAARADIFDLTLTGDATIGFTGGEDGQSVMVRVKQDATGGRSITWGAMVRVGSDIPSVPLSSAAGKTDYVGLIYHATDDKYDIVSYVRGF